MAQRKTPAKKSPIQKTTKKKTTSRKPSSKANKGTKLTKTSQTTTPKSKSNNDDYLTIADLKKGYSKLKSNMPGYKKKGKKIAGEIVEDAIGPVLLPVVGAYYGKEYLKKKYGDHKIKKQAKKDEKNAKYIEKYNKKLNLTKDENGVIETENDIKKIEPSPLDRSQRKKRFKF